LEDCTLDFLFWKKTDDGLQVARSNGEAMALEEEAERGNGHRKRSTLDYPLARRTVAFSRCLL
jgi:hypothetical protein